MRNMVELTWLMSISKPSAPGIKLAAFAAFAAACAGNALYAHAASLNETKQD